MTTKQKVGWGVVTVLVLVYALFPVASILMTSFKTPADLTSGKFLPTQWVGENYSSIFVGQARELFVPSLINSIGICLIATAVAEKG